jgi:hypothetical protein
VEEHPVRADVRWRVHLRDVKVLRVWVVRVGPTRPDEVIDTIVPSANGVSEDEARIF